MSLSITSSIAETFFRDPPPAVDPIVALADEMETLIRQSTALENAWADEKDPTKKKRLWQRHNEANDRYHTIQKRVIAAQATSLAGALIQLRIAGCLAQSSSADNKIRDMVLSAIGVLEQHLGIPRDQWAGDWYVGEAS